MAGEAVLKRDDGSAQRHDALLEAAGVGVWTSDLARHTLWLSASFRVLLGHDKIEGATVRTAWTELLHRDDVTTALRARRDLIDGSKDCFTVDLRLMTVSGAFEPVTVRGSVTLRLPDGTPRMLGGVAFPARDTMASLSTRLQLKDAVLRESRDGAAITDENGFFAYMNPAHREMFGISATTDITGLHWSELYDPQIAQQIETEVFPRLDRESSWRGELKGRRIDTGRPVSQEVSLTRGLEGGLICATRDISERLRHEKERLRLREKLITLQRREVVHLLCAGVAHDLMNLLGLIQQLSSLIETDTTREPAEAAVTISRTVKQAATLVRERLMLGEEAVSSRRIDLRRPVTRVVELFRETLPQTVTFEAALPEQCIEILGTETEIVQVTLNLLLNAADAVDPADTHIALDLSIVTCELHHVPIAGTLTRGAQYARLSVSDNGTGISDEIKARILMPYFSTKGDDGSGLGMYVITEIAKSHDGAIAVESAVGQGTRIDVYLPLAQITSTSDHPLLRPNA